MKCMMQNDSAIHATASVILASLLAAFEGNAVALTPLYRRTGINASILLHALDLSFQLGDAGLQFPNAILQESVLALQGVDLLIFLVRIFLFRALVAQRI